MAAKRHERTLKMMESFLKLHNEGRSIEEIATMHDLSVSSIYRRLDEIAARAGVDRKSLLKKPFEADHSGRNFTRVEPVDRAKFNEDFEALILMVGSVQTGVCKTIDDLGTMNDLMEEEIRWQVR